MALVPKGGLAVLGEKPCVGICGAHQPLSLTLLSFQPLRIILVFCDNSINIAHQRACIITEMLALAGVRFIPFMNTAYNHIRIHQDLTLVLARWAGENHYGG